MLNYILVRPIILIKSLSRGVKFKYTNKDANNKLKKINNQKVEEGNITTLQQSQVRA